MTPSSFAPKSSQPLPRIVRLGQRAVQLTLSAAAHEQLARESALLDIELEVYFSCFLRKRVRFLRTPHDDVLDRAALTDKVTLSVRPVMTRACRVSAAGAEPELERLPIVRGAACMPRWVRLDCRADGWVGDFGF